MTAAAADQASDRVSGRVGAVVVAAGRGERFGGPVVKALVPLAGRPLVAHAVAHLRAAGVGPVVVVHPDGHREDVAAALAAVDPDASQTGVAGVDAGAPEVGVDADASRAGVAGVTLVPGGDTRSASVRAGLAALPDTVGVVAIHDAARAAQPAAVIAATIAAVSGDVLAAAPAVAVVDTLKRVEGDTIVGTVDRDALVAVQTPQVVRRDVLLAVHAGTPDATDDLDLVERWLAEDPSRLDEPRPGAAGPPDRHRPPPRAGRVVHVSGSVLGHKVTRREDVVLLEALLAAAEDGAAIGDEVGP